jgi:hypothetical protein
LRGARLILRVAIIGIVVAISAALLSACGGSSGEGEVTGTYRARVISAEFPTRQRLGQTSLLRLDVRNTGAKTIPSLVTTISVAGKEGREGALPFGFRDPEPGLAQPDRPVWVLAAGYPKRAGDPSPGGATTSNPKTFNLGALKPGETAEWIWKVSAVDAGRHTIVYRIGAGLNGGAKVKTASGVTPGGSFVVGVSTVPPNTIVTDSGKVVPIDKSKQKGNGS